MARAGEVYDDDGNEVGYEQMEPGQSVSDNVPGHVGFFVAVETYPDDQSLCYVWVQWGTS